MKTFLASVAVFSVLFLLAGCKGEKVPPIPTETLSPKPSVSIPSPSPTDMIFVPYTDHTDPNADVMSLQDRKALSPLETELVRLLDDYVYYFNHNIPQKDHDKFAAVDTPRNIRYGQGVISVKNPHAFNKMTSPGVTSLAADVEVRYHKEDQEPFWKGTQLFIFSFDEDNKLRLGYWQEPES